MLRDRPKRTEKPFVYHLDVGAMYPNIILTNRLQPSAIVNDSICAACDFNQSKNDCKRKLEWVWRGDYNPATKSEYERAKNQLIGERFEGKSFHELDESTQAKLVSTRLKQYAKNAYNKTKVTEEITRVDTVCMRENDFYVDTVRTFRDKRYVLKKLTKVWGKKIKDANDAVSKKEAEDKALVYDSLQVAHKCILNSFYGYVMRKGARWRSMEMAGITTKTGADIIVQARNLVEQIGRPLELDTDGIWCILPKSFPDNFYFKLKNGSNLKVEYPCTMLNADVHDHFTNHQYQTLIDSEKLTYESRSECSIFFEVDGPYRCMVIPASTEEGRLLKKRYAVFNDDGSLAELKGFELKRRGELELIKQFQSQVFERFLNGSTLIECYDSVAEIANYWIDVLDTQGESLETDELVDLISENRSMSRQLEDYGDQKGTSQTTARRLGEFLGAEIIKDKGLNCKFIIAEKPHGAPVTERAIPTAIWKAEPAVMKHFLRKWLKSPGMEDLDFDLRNILDWDYYRDRLGKTIQKIITIPAALQKVPNPVPRIPHPEWLQKTVTKLNDRYQQQSLESMFGPASRIKESSIVMDIEDITGRNSHTAKQITHRRSHTRRSSPVQSKETDGKDIPGINDATDHETQKIVLSKDTFQDWLAKKKKSWNFRDRKKRNQRENSSLHVNLRESGIKKQRKAMGSMSGYIRDAAESLNQFEWHIVEIRDVSSTDRISRASGGEFTMWVMLSNGFLQRLQVSVPRVLYVNCKEEIEQVFTETLTIKRVEKILPHNKVVKYLYEISMPEQLYLDEEWLEHFSGKDNGDIIESFFETSMPTILRVMTSSGAVCRVTATSTNKSGKYNLSDLKLVENPTQGDYLNDSLDHRYIFIYENIQLRSKTGLVAAFIVENNNKVISSSMKDVSCKCHMWFIKPGGDRGQRAISQKQCVSAFSELIGNIQNPEYTSLAEHSICSMEGMSFVANETRAFKGINDLLNMYSQGNNGPTFLLVNSSKHVSQLRKFIPSFNSYPLIQLPGPTDSTSSSLPPLNWEPYAVQLCYEAYLHLCAVSLPKRLLYSRFSNVPIGNLGLDADITSYDIGLSRLLLKNRALSWASHHGFPDTGFNSLPLVSGSNIMGLIGEQFTGTKPLDSNDIWGDENGNIKPVVAFPGAYRSICVEIEVHDLVIAAIKDAKGAFSNIGSSVGNHFSGASFDGVAPLGDEMSTAFSLHVLKCLAQNWLRQASDFNNTIADHLLANFYRLISSPEAALNDPALHRVLLSLMRSTFNELLGELQRLGCTIVTATFHHIIVATNKNNLSGANEYIEFIISTIQKNFSEQNVDERLSRVSLLPRNFYSNYLFLDEHNFGAIVFEEREPEDQEEAQWSFMRKHNGDDIVTVPMVYSAWNIMHYLPSEVSREYFRAIIGRYSRDVYRKQIVIEEKQSSQQNSNGKQSKPYVQLIEYKKKLISKHFASDITRAVAEIAKSEETTDSLSRLPGSRLNRASAVIEFIKSILVILELDPDVETEVQMLKKSLFSQVGIQEYSNEAKWSNPCANLVLPDVFCTVCQDSRDIDLCILSSGDENDEDNIKRWVCEDCQTPFNTDSIECRLVEMIGKKCVRYQLQDLRSKSNGQVATRVLSRQSDDAKELKADISREDITSQLLILHNLATYYNLEWLLETTEDLLESLV